MGTRNLTMVIKDSEPVVAQYGQWDGYPSGQGATALKFLKTKSLKKFKKKLELIRLSTEEDEKELQTWLKSEGVTDGWMNMDQAGKFHQKYPLLSRDKGAEILQLIQDNKEPNFLRDSSSFAQDSLFCEWAYVIDLDKETFEVYSGFNQLPLEESERFYDGDTSVTKEYFPVRLVKSFSLNDLPSEGEFVKACEPVEEEVED